MPSIIQAGTSLQRLSDAGVLSTLTLPTGITLRTDVPPRWVIYGNYAVLVNTPSQPLIIDALGIVRLLTPKPPRLQPVLTGQGSSTLTGHFMVKATFVTLDAFGNIISESDYSPPSLGVTITSQFLQAASVDVSPDQITLRRLYRTTDNGAVYFQWVDLNGNVITTIQDNLPDAGLSIFGAPVLGTPPRLTCIAEFRGRLFGVGDTDIDDVRYTEAGIQYAWPSDNSLPIPGKGSDLFGVVGLLPRRDALGVGRRNLLAQITGSGAETLNALGFTDTDLNVIILSRELGLESQETMKVFRDTAYFLWKDGVYTWNSAGITCISNGTDTKGNVRSWFTTTSYFNQDLFPIAFATIDVARPCYRLYLAAAGSSVVNTWIEYNIADGTWWGPHLTTLFTPTSAFLRTNSANRSLPMVGSAASVFQDQDARQDGLADTATAITFDAIGKRHAVETPDQEKFFGEVSILGVAQPTGHLSVVSRVGSSNASITKTQYADLTKSRQRLGRLGTGKHAQLELVNAEVGVDVNLFGYEINPVNLIGRR